MRTSVALLCNIVILLSVVLSAVASNPAESIEAITTSSLQAQPASSSVSNCTVTCRSYVYVGVAYSYKQIGPQTVVAWNVISATTASVTRVTVDLYVASQRYTTFTLTDSSPMMTQSYNLSSGNIYGNGTFRLYPGYSSGSFGGVPQLGVSWQSTAYGVRGGFNGSVIVFNLNTPTVFNVRNITSNGNISLGWTACISRRFGSPELVNATVWTYMNNNTMGAAYLDLFRSPQQNLFYSLNGGSNNSTNVSLALAFTPTGIKVDAYTCVPSSPTNRNSCNRTNFYLFDVKGCPSNTFMEEEREDRERYPNTPTIISSSHAPLASMSTASTEDKLMKASSTAIPEEKEVDNKLQA